MQRDLDAADRAPEARAMAIVRHHIPATTTVATLLPLARDPSIVPVPFRPGDPVAIERALRLDRRLPTAVEIDAARFRIEDAAEAGPAKMSEIAAVLPALLRARASFKAEKAGTMLAIMLELLRVEMAIEPFGLDVLVLGLMTSLRESRFTPEPAEIIASIQRARREIAQISEELVRLSEARDAVDDLLVAAGLRSPPPESDDDMWIVPSPRSRRAA